MPETLTFSQIRTKHADYLRRTNTTTIPPELLTELQQFVESVRLAGQVVVDEDDREYLRSLLTFWGNWLYNLTRTYPNINLEPFTSEAAAAHGREVGEKLVKGEPVTTSQNNQLWLGCLALIGLVIIVAVCGVVALPRLLPGGAMPPTATAVVAASNVPEITATPASAATESFTETPAPPITATPAETPVSVATPTSSSGQGLDGSGEIKPVGFISVQLIDPLPANANISANQSFSIGTAYSNMQPGWTLYYAITDLQSGQEYLVLGTLSIDSDNPTGTWTEEAVVPSPGDYVVGVFVTTTTESTAMLQRFAQSGEPLPSTFSLEGIIEFSNLGIVHAN